MPGVVQCFLGVLTHTIRPSLERIAEAYHYSIAKTDLPHRNLLHCDISSIPWEDKYLGRMLLWDRIASSCQGRAKLQKKVSSKRHNFTFN